MIENFTNIGGYEYPKKEAVKIANYFKNYEMFKENGTRLPRGILFYGAPGTGKTLFAKAIVNESKANTYVLNTESLCMENELTMSIKKVFDKARENTPSIILIDELDRLVNCDNSLFSQTSDEERETLRCLLTEIDKSKDYDVLIIATSNSQLERVPAPLVRDGRIEKHIIVEKPTFEDRKEILSLYLSQNDIFEDISISNIAHYTNGLSGASLSTLVNDVLINCIASNKKADFEDFIEPIEAIRTSNIKKKIPEDGNDSTIYHEIGHFVVNHVLTGEIGMINVTPYANHSGGRFTRIKEEFYKKAGSYSHYLNTCTMLVAGNETVEIMLKEKYDGASNDLGKFTELFYIMLENGMLDEKVTSDYLAFNLGRDKYHEGLKLRGEFIAECFKKYYKECVDKTREIINNNLYLVEALYNELKNKSYLTEDEIKKILEANPVIK